MVSATAYIFHSIRCQSDVPILVCQIYPHQMLSPFYFLDKTVHTSLFSVYGISIAPIYHTGNTPVLFASTKCNITILYNWETVHNPIYYPILLKTLPPTLNQLLKAITDSPS